MKFEATEIVNVNEFGYVHKTSNNQSKTIRISEFPKWLVDERKRQGLSKEELAEASNVSMATINKLENGASPTIVTCIKLTDALGYNVSMSSGKITIDEDSGEK